MSFRCLISIPDNPLSLALHGVPCVVSGLELVPPKNTCTPATTSKAIRAPACTTGSGGELAAAGSDAGGQRPGRAPCAAELANVTYQMSSLGCQPVLRRPLATTIAAAVRVPGHAVVPYGRHGRGGSLTTVDVTTASSCRSRVHVVEQGLPVRAPNRTNRHQARASPQRPRGPAALHPRHLRQVFVAALNVWVSARR